jgi:hypothetical protein
MVDRLADVIGLLSVGFMCWVISLRTGAPGVVGFGLAALLVLLVTLSSMAVRESGRAILDPMQRVNGSFPLRRINNALHAVAASLRHYRSLTPHFVVSVLALSLASHAAGTVSYAWLADSLELGVPLTAIGWVRACVVLLTMLPISISGLGVREGALVFLLAPYGASGADAIALSLLRLLGTLTIGLVGGVYELRRVAWPR